MQTIVNVLSMGHKESKKGVLVIGEGRGYRPSRQVFLNVRTICEIAYTRSQNRLRCFFYQNAIPNQYIDICINNERVALSIIDLWSEWHEKENSDGRKL